MKKLFFMSLFLLQISTIKTMDPGLYAGPSAEQKTDVTNSKPNDSIINKIKNKPATKIFTFENFKSAFDHYIMFPAAVFAVIAYPTYHVWNELFRQHAWDPYHRSFDERTNIGWPLTEKILKFFKKPATK